MLVCLYASMYVECVYQDCMIASEVCLSVG